MKRDVVVYFGMGFLPDRNAVACREQALSYIVKESGYIPVLIGISDKVPFGEYEKSSFDGVDCYSVKYAKTLTEKFKDLHLIPKTLMCIFENIGVERIKCFIMQDYQLGPMKALKRYCAANGIAFAADIMDWFTPTRDCSVSKNISKTADTFLRMNFFYPFLKNKIYISHKFKQHFQDNKEKNILVLPCTCKDVSVRLEKDVCNNNIVVTFAGFLGLKCEKEKLDWIIKALYENKSTIELNVIGVNKEEFITKMPELAPYITEYIHFLGYLPREHCVKVLQESDFSTIVRKRNKLTEYGFSSKICEAFAHGIPVIATNKSDNGIYIKDGINGFVCDSDYESLKELLKRIEKTDRDLIKTMKSNLLTENPLSVKEYVVSFSEFIENLNV